MTIEGEEALYGTPEKSLAPLAPFIGRWRTSGSVLERRERAAEVAGFVFGPVRAG
jgi:hypothetical protein